MFRHHHHPVTIGERIDQLMVAVFLADEGERLSRIGEHLAANFIYIKASAVYEGSEGLSEAYARFRHESWRRTSLQRSSAVDVNHAHFRYTWRRTDGTETVSEGVSFGWMDEVGLIARIVAFDGLAPPPLGTIAS